LLGLAGGKGVECPLFENKKIKRTLAVLLAKEAVFLLKKRSGIKKY